VTATLATAQAILKRLYPEGVPEALIAEKSPTFGMLPKDTDFYGDEAAIAVTYGPTTGRSSTFSTAQANVGAVRRVRFLLSGAGAGGPRAEDFALFRVNGHALRAAGNSKGALTNLLEDEGDRTFDVLTKSLCHGIFGTGGGSIAQVGSTNAMVLTLKNKSDIVHFEVGQKIVSDSVDGTGTVGTDVATITAVDEDAGTISRSDANWTAGGEYTNDWYIFHEGDYGLKIKGLAAWIPSTAPSGSDSFFGVNRSVHPTKLAGWRYAASLANETSLEQMWINVGARMFHSGARCDVGIMNPLDFAIFVNSLGSKVQTDRILARGSNGATAELGYDAIRIYTGVGTIKIVADQYCPKNRAYLLQTNTWKIWSLGPLPGWLDEDDVGNILRVGTENSYEGRIGCYWQMYTKAPWKNATIDTSAITAPS
jgi:hypothetical protein